MYVCFLGRPGTGWDGMFSGSATPRASSACATSDAVTNPARRPREAAARRRARMATPCNHRNPGQMASSHRLLSPGPPRSGQHRSRQSSCISPIPPTPCCVSLKTASTGSPVLRDGGTCHGCISATERRLEGTNHASLQTPSEGPAVGLGGERCTGFIGTLLLTEAPGLACAKLF